MKTIGIVVATLAIIAAFFYFYSKKVETDMRQEDENYKQKVKYNLDSIRTTGTPTPDTAFLGYVLGSTKKETEAHTRQLIKEKKIYEVGGTYNYNLKTATTTMRCFVQYFYYKDTLAGVQVAAVSNIGKGQATLADIEKHWVRSFSEKYGTPKRNTQHELGYADEYFATPNTYIGFITCGICDPAFSAVTYQHKYYHPLMERQKKIDENAAKAEKAKKLSKDL